MTKVHVVGHDGPEHNWIQSVHKTREGALKAWNELRLGLIRDAKRLSKGENVHKRMWQKIIKNLSCKAPEKINNYPHETPYIRAYEVGK